MIHGSGTLPLRKSTNIPMPDIGIWTWNDSEYHLKHRGRNGTEILRNVLRFWGCLSVRQQTLKKTNPPPQCQVFAAIRPCSCQDKEEMGNKCQQLPVETS